MLGKKCGTVHISGAWSYQHRGLVRQGDTLAAGQGVSTSAVVPQRTGSRAGAACLKWDNISLTKVHMQECVLQQKR